MTEQALGEVVPYERVLHSPVFLWGGAAVAAPPSGLGLGSVALFFFGFVGLGLVPLFLFF